MNFKKRIQRLRNCLQDHSCEALLVDNPIDIFYLTGIELSTGLLLIGETSARLIVDSRYYEACKNSAPMPVVLQKPDSLQKILSHKTFQNITKIAFDSEKSSYDKYKHYQSLLNKVKQENPTRKIRLIPLSGPVTKVRTLKDDEEIQALKVAAQLGSEGYNYLLTLLKPGITEIELAIELEIFWKRKGSKGLAFDSIIAFGANSSMPHYKPGSVPLKKGQPVLIDIGVNFHHYHSDMTRVPFFGKPSKEMKKIYEVVLEAQERALDLCKPGTPISELDKIARETMKKQDYAKYFIHNLGHGVGLEIHELPFLRGNSTDTLEEGMVITIEPGIYLSGIGGVRIEDTIVITKNGHENLSTPSKELVIIN